MLKVRIVSRTMEHAEVLTGLRRELDRSRTELACDLFVDLS
jgi:light-regulated signal transduction histidine kinase (bacteriophytochrome)